MAEHDLHQRVEVREDNRTVATAEVTTPEGSGGTARVSLHAEPGHISPGRRASLVDAVLRSPRSTGKRTPESSIPSWRQRVTAPASGTLRGRHHPAQPDGARSLTRTFHPAAPRDTFPRKEPAADDRYRALDAEVRPASRRRPPQSMVLSAEICRSWTISRLSRRSSATTGSWQGGRPADCDGIRPKHPARAPGVQCSANDFAWKYWSAAEMAVATGQLMRRAGLAQRHCAGRARSRGCVALSPRGRRPAPAGPNRCPSRLSRSAVEKGFQRSEASDQPFMERIHGTRYYG